MDVEEEDNTKTEHEKIIIHVDQQTHVCGKNSNLQNIT